MDNEVYKLFLEKDNISARDLEMLGYDKDTIATILNELVAMPDGCYRLKNADGFYAYGETFVASGDFFHANQVFKKCLNVDPYHLGANKRCLFESLVLGHYKDAITYLDALQYAATPTECADFRFIVFLMSFCTDLPEKYAKLSRRLTMEDLLIPEDSPNYANPTLMNDLRAKAYHQKIYEALGIFKISVAKRKQSLDESLIEKLLYLAKNGKNKFNKNVTRLVEDDDFENLLSVLEKERELHDLSPTHRSFLYLARDIDFMNNTGEVPEPKKTDVKDTLGLICSRQYERAYVTNLVVSYNMNVSMEHNKLHTLLKETIRLKYKLLSDLPWLPEPLITDSTASADDSDQDTMFSILALLIAGNITEALELIETTLIAHELEDYYYLIADLVNISILRDDITFSQPLIALCQLITGKFEMETPKYVGHVQYCLKANLLEEARLFLDILKRSHLKGHSDMPEAELEMTICELEATLASKTAQNEGSKPYAITPLPDQGEKK